MKERDICISISGRNPPSSRLVASNHIEKTRKAAAAACISPSFFSPSSYKNCSPALFFCLLILFTPPFRATILSREIVFLRERCRKRAKQRNRHTLTYISCISNVDFQSFVSSCDFCLAPHSASLSLLFPFPRHPFQLFIFRWPTEKRLFRRSTMSRRCTDSSSRSLLAMSTCPT